MREIRTSGWVGDTFGAPGGAEDCSHGWSEGPPRSESPPARNPRADDPRADTDSVEGKRHGNAAPPLVGGADPSRARPGKQRLPAFPNVQTTDTGLPPMRQCSETGRGSVPEQHFDHLIIPSCNCLGTIGRRCIPDH